MRHRVYGAHLGRDRNERTALFRSLARGLFLHGTIQTTESKAKSVKGLIDKIINLAKNKDSQRLLPSYVIQQSARERLVKEIAPKLKDRNSGYTSIVKLGRRQGDGAMVVRMSLIGAEKLEPVKKATSDKRQAISKETKKKKVETKSKSQPKARLTKTQAKKKGVKA